MSNKKQLKRLKYKLNVMFGGRMVIDLGDDFHEANSCRRKVKYRKDSAVRAAIEMTAKKGELFDAYECTYCKGWHVGHSFALKRDSVAK